MWRRLKIYGIGLALALGSAALVVLVYLAWLAAPLTVLGAALGVLGGRPWRKDRGRRLVVTLAAATAGALLGALMDGSRFGPHGPHFFPNPASRALNIVSDGIFAALLVAGGGLAMVRGVWGLQALLRGESPVPGQLWKRLILGPVGGILFALIIFAAWVGLVSRQASDAFYTEGASLLEPGLYDAPLDLQTQREMRDLSVRGHRIGPGDGSVIAVRWYSPGRWDVFDDEIFEKLTITLPGRLDDRGTISLTDADAAITAYTRGASAWPQAACYGHPASGTLSYHRSISGALVVIIGMEVRAVASRNYCDGAFVRKRLILWRRTLDSLSPWLGGCAGEHIYQETYRRSAICTDAD